MGDVEGAQREIERAMIELHASGFSESEVVARQNRLRKNILERTEVLLKEHFILERIAEEESIEEEPQDYDMEIARIAIQQTLAYAKAIQAKAKKQQEYWLGLDWQALEDEFFGNKKVLESI